MIFDDIKKLYEQGSLRDIDYYLAEMLLRRFPGTMPVVLLAAALASRNLTENHICFDLEQAAGKKWPETEDKCLHQVDLPEKEEWIELLRGSKIFSPASDLKKSVLVGFGSRIYLRRYFDYEKSIADKLIDLTKTVENSNSELPSISDNEFGELIDILFPNDKDISNKQQLAAAEVILSGRLLILAGGPGTGKTYTLARLTAMLVTAFKKSGGRAPEIRLAAPTGKAAMRMCESVREAKEGIRNAIPKESSSKIVGILANCIDDIPENAGTIHRLMGNIINSTKFRHNAGNPLSADILIIDEASMVDLSMMAKILDALPEHTKLILLGDMHQITSVNPGYVLGDICKAAQDNAESGLGKSLVELTYSRRFTPGSPIDLLSSALHTAGDNNDPDGMQAWNKLQKLSGGTNNTGIVQHKTPASLRDAAELPMHDFRETVVNNYKPLLKAKTVQEAFDAISKFRILSPLSKGPHGVITINRLIEDSLSYKNMKKDSLDFTPLNLSSEFYDRRMIMVHRNDYGLKLFNGDIGIVMDDDADGATEDELTSAKKVVWFENTDEDSGERSYRSFPCNMIPEHETSFAITIHKSQGSEYNRVMIIMPDRDNQKLFTKELLYTAITRAKEEVNIWCNEAVFKNTACRKAECASGLVDQLDQMLNRN